MVQSHIQKTKQATKHEQAEIAANPEPIKNEKLDADTMDLLDAVDEVLGHLTDTEAQEFVANYIQKGGQ